jgi:hypothetical protein
MGVEMQPQDAFGVAIRIIGLVMTLRGLWSAAFGTAQVARLVRRNRHGIVPYFVNGLVFIVVGVALLMGADTLAHAVYK